MQATLAELAALVGGELTGDGLLVVHGAATLRDALDVSDSVLSKHLTALESAGYITTRRELRKSRQRVWVSLTPTGRRAYAGHVLALQQIIMMDHQARPSTTHAIGL